MKPPPLTSLRCGPALFAALVLPLAAEAPKKPPLGRYAELWTSSPFTVTPPKVKPVPAAGKGAEAEAGKPKVAPDKKQAPGGKGAFVAKEWLKKFEPVPVPAPEALTQLERIASRGALRRGLVLKRRQILPEVKGKRYHRARLQIEVFGREPALYQWLDHLQSPNDFRAITNLRLSPARNDDTQVECTVLLEGWYLPEGKGLARGVFKGDPMPELRPLTEIAHYPLELLFQVAKPFPKAGGRLQRIEVRNQIDETGKPLRDVRLHGVADELATVNTYSRKLVGSVGLRDYKVLLPPPAETRTGKWGFVLDATFQPKEKGE